jgi:WD40 repeat protein
LWNARTWDIAKRLSRFEAGVEGAAFSPDGSVCFGADGMGKLQAFRVHDGQPLPTFRNTDFTRFGRAISAVAAAPDGNSLFLGLGVWHDEPTPNPADGLILQVNARSGEELRKLPGMTASIISLALSPNGARLAAAGLDGLVHVWDTATGQQVQTFTGHEHIARGVAFAPDNQRLASSSFDGTVRLWQLGRPDTLAVLRSPRAPRFNHLAFAPDGTRLAAASPSLVAVWAVG